MARLILHGAVANIELTSDPTDGQTIARCVSHDIKQGSLSIRRSGWCAWTDRYDTLDDAEQGAAGHADAGRS